MPTFVYLPGGNPPCWLNLDHVIAVDDEPDYLLVSLTGEWDSPEDGVIPNEYKLAGTDREIFLKALSKLTPKELT